MAPHVSILIPAYKPNWFRSTLDSALNQNFDDYEIIVSDDSQDNKIFLIVQDAREKHPKRRIKYLRNPAQLGEEQNFFKAAQHAEGHYVKPLFDDDILHPSILTAQTSMFLKVPTASLVSCRRTEIDEHGDQLNPTSAAYLSPFDSDIVIDGADLFSSLSYLAINALGEPSCTMFRTEDLLALNGSLYSVGNESFFGVGDLALYFNLYKLRRGPIVLINEPLCQFRRSSIGTTAKISSSTSHSSAAHRFQTMLKQSDFFSGNRHVRIQPVTEKEPTVRYFDFVGFWRRYGKPQETPSSHRDILDIHGTSESLNALRTIKSTIPERHFHEHIHFLYDIRSHLGNTREITYLEIGSYVGHSASLILSHHYPTVVYCVDPLTLDPSHFCGTAPQSETLRRNLDRQGRPFKIFMEPSSSPSVLEMLARNHTQLDILFIDGDHRYQAVINDFVNYSPLVREGGFIVFDDYLDQEFSPDVNVAVNDIVEAIARLKLPYKVLGAPDNTTNCEPAFLDAAMRSKLNLFVLQKIVQEHR